MVHKEIQLKKNFEVDIDMKIEKAPFYGCYIIEPEIFYDERGYFFETFNLSKFQKLTGETINFVQDNQSYSKKGVLRGLHFQKGEFAQAKLIRVITGNILDVVVDLRSSSKTFGKSFSLELSEDNKKQLFIPKGMAHGFLVISKEAVVEYKCDNFYNKDSESGIIYNDKALNISWQLPESELLLSDKDLKLPTFEEFINQQNKKLNKKS